MQELLLRYLSSGFAEFEGLNIAGSIPIKQELINELLAEILQSGFPPQTPPQGQGPSGASSPPKIDPGRLLERIKRAEVQADDGRIIVNFEIRVEEEAPGGMP